MRDDGEQRTRRPARRTLALFPIPDGFDGNAKTGGKFLLRELCAAAQITHFDRTGLARRYGWLQRELPAVSQFDNSSVCLQPQAHVANPDVADIIGEGR
jgi:hypothetical protein